MIGTGIGPVEIAVRAKPATSAPSTHTITISNNGFGVPPCTITPVGPVVVVNHGANQSIRMVGERDDDNPVWWIESLYVDGFLVGVASSSTDYTYTFTNVIVNHTLVVTFSNGA